MGQWGRGLLIALPLVRCISTVGRLFNLWGFLSAKWDDNTYLVGSW